MIIITTAVLFILYAIHTFNCKLKKKRKHGSVMPSLQDVVLDLRKQVEQLCHWPKSSRCESPTLSGQVSTPSSSRSSSQNTSPYVSASESDVEGDLVNKHYCCI